MAIIDMLPTLDDTALENLFANATRISGTGGAKQRDQATEMLPLLVAERARRKELAAEAAAAKRLAKPPVERKTPVKKRATKAKAEAVDTEAEAEIA